MKVFPQEWMIDGTWTISISKDKDQLEATKKKYRGSDEDVEPEGTCWEYELPDDSPFTGMVQKRTIFLHRDESNSLGLS